MVNSIDKKQTDDRREKNLAIVERYFIGRTSEEAEGFNPNLFDEFRLDGGLLTFTDPRVNR